MSIVNPEYSLLKNVSDEDMAKAKHIYGPDIPIIAVWRPHPNAKKFRFICWYNIIQLIFIIIK